MSETLVREAEPTSDAPSATDAPETGPAARRILYCHCAFSRVVDEDAKREVLAGLSRSGVAFDAVPDLCELAARQDPSLDRLAAGREPVDIVACYPRAVRWLFHAAEADLPEDRVRIHNMRAETPEAILATVLDGAPHGDSTRGAEEAKEGAA